MSGHLVCKSGFGLGKVAKLMLASFVVLSAFSGNVWADEAEVPQEPAEKEKESGLSSGSSKDVSQKLPPKSFPSITTSNNKVKTTLKDFSVSIGPAQNHCAPWLLKGEVDLAMLKDRISILLNRVTNYGPGTPGFGISENIVEFVNNKGTIVVPKDIAKDLCSLPSGRAKRYEWGPFTDMFARFIAKLLTDNAYGNLPRPRRGITVMIKDLHTKGIKEGIKDLRNNNTKDYYKSRLDAYNKIKKHILSALSLMPNFD